MKTHPANRPCRVAILYTTHRPENVALLEREMSRHDAVYLEEAASPDLPDMVEGRISVEDYLASMDGEYPEFDRLFCRMLIRLHRKGIAIFQVEPFLEELVAIHEFFASGGDPSGLPRNTDRHRVYSAEREATGALLDFYRISQSGTFDETVAAVLRFARVDALRFRLRDELRGAALAGSVAAHGSACIEAGTMHQWLWRELHRRLKPDLRVCPVHPAGKPTAAAGAKRRNLGPGDVLTLIYIYRPDAASPQLDLLAARSLIYVKLLEKEEMKDKGGTFPHLRDELAAAEAADHLSFEDCRRLYPSIRRAATADVRRIVKRYLAAQGLIG